MLRTATHPNWDVEFFLPQEGYLAELVEAFSAETRSQFLQMSQIRTVRARTVLAVDGQEAAEIGFVLSGILAMSKHLPDGRVSIAGLLLPNDMYGRISSGPSQHQVEALSETHVLSFKRSLFQSLLLKEPDATQLLLAHVLDELEAAREWTLLLNGSRVVQRVASFLVLLVRRSGGHLASLPEPVQAGLSREDLASYLGTRPESLSRAFHELADKKIIRILDPSEFEILDLQALLDVSGQDLITSE
ncbi:MAG TPA: Crp/Fnr family transcriptional regulator [Rubellimicrobium sp.]|nr:Crp/Fnr family transcriptional regulator [Rubellimicrobium sp.]